MKNVILTVCALALSVVCVQAAELQKEMRNLKEIVDVVRSGNDEVIMQEKSPGEDWSAPKAVSRDAVLSALYLNLAGLEYINSIETGLAADQRPEVNAALSRVQKYSKVPVEDIRAVTVDPEVLETIGGCSSSRYCCGGYNPLGYCWKWCRTCVMAVRGGRKVETRSDKRLSVLNRSLEEVSREVGGSPTESAAEIHLDRARIYEKMARTTAASARTSRTDLPRRDLIQDLGTRHVDPDFAK